MSEHDKEYREVTVTKVEPGEAGWSITAADGWSFWVQASYGVVPHVGQTARFYGKGIGHAVRGLSLNGQRVFYRTEAEQEEQDTEYLYPKAARTALERWDAGQSVFTVEMGGLGPGYEQCIHITVFEIIRAFVDKPEVIFSSDGKYVSGEMDKALWGNPTIKELGLSGAQAGAAKSFAWGALKDGWRATVKSVEGDRLIQVSKHFPGSGPTSPTVGSAPSAAAECPPQDVSGPA